MLSTTSPQVKPTIDKTRALSWSSISSFEWNKEQWYERYILKKEQTSTKELEFGKFVGDKLSSDKRFKKEVIRYKIFEKELRCEWDGIPLVGYVDTCDLEKFCMREYKTGKKPWTQKRADEHGQIDMYLLMIYIMYKIKPEQMKVHLDWMPTKDSGDDHDSLEAFLKSKSKIEFVEPFEVKSFETKRTMSDVLKFGAKIKRIYKEMEEYALSHE